MSVGPFGQPLENPLAGAGTCPHCNGVADVSPHPRLNQVCNICGAPRIDMKGAPKLSGRELPHLLAARTAERKRLQWKAGSLFGAVGSGFVFVVMTLWALIFGIGLSWAVTGFLLGAPFLALALAGFARQKGQIGEVERTLREAWKCAARDIVLAHKGGITTQQLAQALPITDAQAEQIAAELSVDNLVTSRVTDDGRLLLQAVAPAGARIDTSGPVSPDEAIGDPLEQRFAELEQAQQEAAARELKKR